MTIDYLLIGHMTADLTAQGRAIGGTVSYCARTVSAFGLKVGVLTSTAPDDPLLNELKHYAEVVSLPAANTSTFENIYDDVRRTQVIRAVANKLTFDDVPPEWRAAPLVHLAPLTGELDPRMAAKFANATTLLTGQGLLREWGDDGVVQFKRWLDPEALHALDWLVLSEEDYVLAPDLEDEYVKAANHFVATRAEKGGTHYDHGTPHTYDTPQVEVINQTGAGDVFAACLLVGLKLLNGDIPTALKLAATLGSNSVTRPGWEGAPTPEEARHALEGVRA